MGKKSQAKKRRKQRRQNFRYELQALYAHLPQIHCKGLCYESCGTIPLFTAEIFPLDQAAPFSLKPHLIPLPNRKGHWMLTPREGENKCPLLHKNRCTAYEVRPYICRSFGVAEGLECPHGCVPDGLLTKREAGILIKELTDLSLLLE